MKHTLLNLTNLSHKEIMEAIKTIPTGVTSLDLSVNRLDEKSGAELAEAFKGIPASVTSLNLSENSLYNKSGTGLAEAFKGIPVSVTSLDLSGNSLYNKSGTGLAEAFKGIPVSVTSLDLSRNGLGKKSGAELADILPVHVQSVQIDGKEFVLAPFHKQKTLDKIDAQLVILEKKTKELNDRKCTNAHEAANTLCNALKNLKNNLNEDNFNYKCFNSDLTQAIKVARPELEKHRGWKEILANIGLCLLGFVVGYLAVCAYQGSFFKFNTDSADKLNELEACLGSSVSAL